VTLHSLGRHVGNGSQDHPRLRHQLGLFGLVLRLGQLGETEVQHLDPAVAGHHDVCWFEIPVNDPSLMRCGQGV
jgi:hypothetical protein